MPKRLSRRPVDLPEGWSYDLPPTAEQQRLDAQMDFLDAQMERLDRFWALLRFPSRLSARELWSVLLVTALILGAGYALCGVQMGTWDNQSWGDWWQSVVSFLTGTGANP